MASSTSVKRRIRSINSVALIGSPSAQRMLFRAPKKASRGGAILSRLDVTSILCFVRVTDVSNNFQSRLELANFPPLATVINLP